MTKFYNYINEKRLLWYHGAYTDNIKKFNTKRSKDKLGAYFSDDKNVAIKTHAGMPYIYTVELNLNKILDLSKYEEDSKKVREFFEELPVSDDFIKHTILTSGNVLSPYKYLEIADKRENIIPKLKKRGYDSIKFRENDANTMVVFDPNKIKILDVEKI